MGVSLVRVGLVPCRVHQIETERKARCSMRAFLTDYYLLALVAVVTHQSVAPGVDRNYLRTDTHPQCHPIHSASGGPSTGPSI